MATRLPLEQESPGSRPGSPVMGRRVKCDGFAPEAHPLQRRAGVFGGESKPRSPVDKVHFKISILVFLIWVFKSRPRNKPRILLPSPIEAKGFYAVISSFLSSKTWFEQTDWTMSRFPDSSAARNRFLAWLSAKTTALACSNALATLVVLWIKQKITTDVVTF